MSDKKSAILGIYSDYSSVEHAVDLLKEAGFGNANIFVLFPEKAGGKNSPMTKARMRPKAR